MNTFILLLSLSAPIAIEQTMPSAIQSYQSQLESLKRQGNWNAIIELGQNAIQEAINSGNLQTEADIRAELASHYFYLGQYTHTLDQAIKCQTAAVRIPAPEAQIRGLYLESAAYRSLAEQDGIAAQEQSRRFTLAKSRAKEALALFDAHGIKNDQLYAKALFNLGAAESQDPEGSFETALNCYQLALGIFEKMQAKEDVIRTLMRIAKIKLEQSDIPAACQLVEQIRPGITGARNQMHLDYLEAQIKFEMNELSDALILAQRALEQSQKLNAKKDEERIRQLIKKIQIYG